MMSKISNCAPSDRGEKLDLALTAQAAVKLPYHFHAQNLPTGQSRFRTKCAPKPSLMLHLRPDFSHAEGPQGGAVALVKHWLCFLNQFCRKLGLSDRVFFLTFRKSRKNSRKSRANSRRGLEKKTPAFVSDQKLRYPLICYLPHFWSCSFYRTSGNPDFGKT